MADDELSADDAEDYDFVPGVHEKESDEDMNGADDLEGEIGVDAAGKPKSCKQRKRGAIAKRNLKPIKKHRTGGIQLSDEEEETPTAASHEDDVKQAEAERIDEAAKHVEQTQNKKADALWESFLSKAGGPALKPQEPAKPTANSSTKPLSLAQLCQPIKKPVTKPAVAVSLFPAAAKLQPIDQTIKAVSTHDTNMVTITKQYDFAGETVRISQEVDASSRAAKLAIKKEEKKAGQSVDEMIKTLEKKNKMSILTKSSLDWNSFKQDEGITDELDHHNKDGYIEKQKFLHRAEVNEWEKQLAMRSNLNNQK